jgi:hypothetical protein
METTKEKLHEEAARHKVETVGKKGEVAKAELQEKVDDVKIGAADLAEKARDKWEDIKDKTADAWENTKDKAEEIVDKAKDKAQEAKETIKEKT